MRHPMESTEAAPAADPNPVPSRPALGTMVRGNGGKSPRRLEALLHGGFECYQIHWWAGTGDEDLAETARRIGDILESPGIPTPVGKKPFISALALYGNPLRRDAEGEEALSSIRRLIAAADAFGCDCIGLFTGRLPGLRWEDSVADFRRVFGNLCREAADAGVRLAMENCPMGGDEDSGDWNMAFGPRQWTRLYEELPAAAESVLGLEWEPAHQIPRGDDPLAQLAEWVPRIIHVHGKDAAPSPEEGWRPTLPGNGITPWDEVMDLLEKGGYRGTIDIEGYHDEEWSGEREIPGQIRALEYLRECRQESRRGAAWKPEGA